MLLVHIALAAWTPRHAALAVHHSAGHSRPVIASSVATAAEVRRDDDGASLPQRLQQRAAHPTRLRHAGPKATAATESAGKEKGGMERFGKDPRSGSPPPGELSAGWAVPAAGSIGQIASLPDLVAALVALHGQSAPAPAQPAWPPGRLRAQGGALGP